MASRGSPSASSTSVGSREVIVILLAIFAIILSLSREGAFQLEEAYYVKFDPTKWENKRHPREDELLPPPLVTDVDGDGQNELLAITTNQTLRIYDEFLSEPEEPFSEPHLKKEISLVPPLRAGHHGQHPIALVSGYLNPPTPMGLPRSQHVVVVKDGGTVLCFDSKFRLQWESHLHGDQDTNDHHTKEVAVIISSAPTRLGDVGTVFVGRRFQKYTETPETGFFGWHAPAPVHRVGEGHRATNEDGEEEVVEQEDHLSDDPHEHDLFESNHFSYFAFDGATGSLRWKHEAGDFENTPEEQARLDEERAELLPQLEQHLLAHVRHLGEQDWTTFRENMLAALPFGWSQRFDTRFELAHFERGRIRGTAAESRKSDLPETHSRSEHVVNPNVILSYRQTGIEVVHLYTGRMLTQLPLAPQGAYADIDADGLIERVRTREGVRKKGECIGVATTNGLQARPIWNVSLCMSGIGSHGGRIASATPLLLRRNPRGSGLPPKYDSIFLMSTGIAACVGARGRVRWTKSTTAGWDTNPGNAMFSKFFDSASIGGMALDEEEKALNEKFQFGLHPAVSAMSARSHEHRDLVLLQGKHLVLLRAADGAELASVRLRSPPLVAPLVGDLNHDGTNDVIVTTSEGYYVYLMYKSVDYEILPLIVSVLLFFAGLSLYLFTSKSNFLFGQPTSASSATTPAQRLKVAAD